MCFFVCLLLFCFVFCCAHSMQTCIPLHGVDKAAETQGSEGPSCSRDKAGDLMSPWLWCHGQSTKSQPYLHVAHQNIPPPLWEAGIWTNRPASIERLHFHQMQCKRVVRSSELMDDLIMGDWLYRFGWSYPHCLSGRWIWKRIASLTGWTHHIQETLIQITLI